jgi:PAS domain S-box-containing protein
MRPAEIATEARSVAPTHTGPESPGSVPDAARLLLTGDVDPRRESVRITIGFIALAAISAVMLNIGIYQGEQQRELKERWGALEASTTNKVTEVRAIIGTFGQQAELVALESQSASSLGPRAAEAFLARDATTLHWSDAAVFDAGGRLRAHGNADRSAPAAPLELLDRAARTHRTALGVLPGTTTTPALMMAAVPIEDGNAAATFVAFTPVDDLLGPSLSSWPGFGISAGAYLAARDGNATVVLSTPPNGFGLSAGARSVSSAGPFRAAAIAATGAESRILVSYAPRQQLWAVSRTIPEIGAGLVAQAREDEVQPSSGNVMAGLIALDFAMVLLVAAALVFWRRQYETGLAQRELDVTRRNANQIQAVFDNAFDAILTFDRSGVIRTANPAAEKIFRRPCAELTGHPLSSILRCEDDKGVLHLPAPGHVIRTEALHADAGGSPVELSTASAGTGEDLVYTAIARDISAQLEAENQIRSIAQGLESSNRRLAELNAQLEEGSRLKSEFLANTSHELRTPLNGMIGFLQLVLDGMCSSPDEERDFMRQALSCSRHLLGLINDVLDIAKIESGKLTLEISDVDVRTVFDEVYTLTHVQAAQKGLALVFEPPPAAARGVRGDFRKIKQVLINLVGNAIKFTPTGTVTVRATEHSGLGHWLFEVEDSGIGIPRDRQGRIFEKFIQGDGSTTRKYGGTGLGLAISRSMIELMGGIIGVQSEGEGFGTRMYFSLPTWHDEADELPQDHASERIEGPAGGPLVLIVEDDPIFRRYISTLLHTKGYRTTEARHAEGGWVLARRLRPAVMVLDYALSCPDGASIRTGWDLAVRMTSDAKTRHIPIIFVTGFDDEVKGKLRDNAFARRPEHLVKPVDGSSLLSKIEHMLGAVHDRTIRILMADDDPSVVAYVRKSLPEDRFHIEVANNGEECLHVLRVQPRGFDLLLLDLMMPGVSGYDVLRELTLSGQHKDLPVLVLTNFPEPRSDEERRLIMGGLVLDVLPKSSVHDNPMILPHIIDWHMQVKGQAADPSGSEDDGEDRDEEAA